MPQTPRRNSQTTPNWADQLSANRYAAGAAVAALLAAYLLTKVSGKRGHAIAEK